MANGAPGTLPPHVMEQVTATHRQVNVKAPQLLGAMRIDEALLATCIVALNQAPIPRHQLDEQLVLKRPTFGQMVYGANEVGVMTSRIPLKKWQSAVRVRQLQSQA